MLLVRSHRYETFVRTIFLKLCQKDNLLQSRETLKLLLIKINFTYSTDIVFLCRFSVWGVFPRRFRLVWQTVFLRFRLHRFVPFSMRKSVCVTDQSKAVTRRFLSLQKTSFTHAQILQTKTAFAETLFRQEPIRFT